jgi:hypothetical protein
MARLNSEALRISEEVLEGGLKIQYRVKWSWPDILLPKVLEFWEGESVS